MAQNSTLSASVSPRIVHTTIEFGNFVHILKRVIPRDGAFSQSPSDF